MRKEHQNIQKKDYRIQAVTALAKPHGEHKVGTPITAITGVKFDDRTLIFSVPNMTALFIDFSYTLWEESQIAFQEENFLNTTSKKIPSNTIFPKNDDTIFNLLQKRMGAIIFAYSALESFANENIPNEYIFKTIRNDKKCEESYDKEQIERSLSLEIKLGDILPSVMSVANPKGKPVWNKLKSLKNLRDKIIHMKSKDRKSSLPNSSEENNTIWEELIDKKQPNHALEAKDIIGYFLSSRIERPRWFENFPFK